MGIHKEDLAAPFYVFFIYLIYKALRVLRVLGVLGNVIFNI
jgi:hypothetical protein